MDEEMKLWKRRARSCQQGFCDSLGDRIYDRVSEEQLSMKIGYALYNAPSEVNKQNKTAVYTKAQQSHIKLVCDTIKSFQPSEFRTFYISYLYIVIRLRNKKNDEGMQVLFRMPKFVEGKPSVDNHIFVDPKPRKYETWSDYLKKNKLPKCEMCYPVNGIYSVIDGSVDVQFGTSPACDKSTAVLTGLDVSSTVLLVGATGVSLASLTLPVAAPVVWGAFATMFASGSYETGRNVYRLHDMKKHGESLGLKNPDSRSAWLSLAGSVVGIASIGSTVIAKGVVATESAISRTGIMTLRIFNVSSLAVSGLGVVNGIITLVMKRNNGTLECNDILQFISVCMFFVNAVVTYNVASKLIDELASSDLTNLFNLRQNASFRTSKDIMEFTDSTTYNVLRQLVIGVKSIFCPDFDIENLESMLLTIVGLLAKFSAGNLTWNKLISELVNIFQKVWRRYEQVIMRAIEDIKNTFEIPHWQQLLPKCSSTNLEIPRQMCEEVDRVVMFCDVTSDSQEQGNLMTFARAFSSAHGSSTDGEFINRFKFYCDCIIAQFKEEKENYENELDSQSSDADFNRKDFDQSYGIQGRKNEFFFVKALNKVNHPDFLGNIDELYDKLPRTEESKAQLPYLQTTKSSFYTFCGPLGEKVLMERYYWDKAVELSGFEVNEKNSTMNAKDNLVLIQPNNEPEIGGDINSELAELEAIVVHSSFINNCHMGFLLVILK